MKLLLGLGITVAAIIVFHLIGQEAVRGIQALATLPQQIINPNIKHIQEQQAQLQQASSENLGLTANGRSQKGEKHGSYNKHISSKNGTPFTLPQLKKKLGRLIIAKV